MSVHAVCGPKTWTPWVTRWSLTPAPHPCPSPTFLCLQAALCAQLFLSNCSTVIVECVKTFQTQQVVHFIPQVRTEWWQRGSVSFCQPPAFNFI